MTIQLRIDPATGKKNVIVNLKSDEDSLPHEHEQQHKAIVNSLIEGGILNAAEVGKIVIEREEENEQPAAPVSTPEQSERQSQAEGS